MPPNYPLGISAAASQRERRLLDRENMEFTLHGLLTDRGSTLPVPADNKKKKKKMFFSSSQKKVTAGEGWKYKRQMRRLPHFPPEDLNRLHRLNRVVKGTKE